MFVPNFTSALPVYTKITDKNQHLIKTSYAARTAEELPVLNRFVLASDLAAANGGKPLAPAKYLDLILYSRDQIIEENKAMGKDTSADKDKQSPWGIVSIKAQDDGFETPMQPITVMRNALGKEVRLLLPVWISS